jgi:hypothetical protein
VKTKFKHHNILIFLFLFACEGTKTEDCATTEDGRGHVISVFVPSQAKRKRKIRIL